MKRRVSVLLALVLLLQLLPGTAWAATAATGSMDNFTAVKSYDNAFADISTDDWYYQNVVALYELGLSNGDGQGNFAGDSSVTVAQALTFAARIYSLYTCGDAEEGPAAFSRETDTLWYMPYIRYLYNAGVIATGAFQDYTAAATRAQVAYLLAHVLPQTALEEINQEAVCLALSSSRLMTDITEDTLYYDEILQLYRWGVVGGSDDSGSFYPARSITRSELAAMLTRLVGLAEPVTLSWSILDAFSAQGTTYADLVTATGIFHSAPTTAQEVEDVVWYMLANGMSSITLRYGDNGLTTEEASAIAQLFLNVLILHPEFMYNQISSSVITTRGLLTVTFGSTSIENSTVLEGRRQYALDKAIAVHDQLWSEGQLTAEMSEMEKAWVYFQWICENCQYDYSLQTLSHTSYSVFAGGIAVCDGYTGAYNLLLRLEGIETYSVTQGEGSSKHMWSAAILDGETYHLDATWADGGQTIRKTYFAMTPEDSLKLHSQSSAYSGTTLPQ